MKCLCKYEWIKLPRAVIPEGNGIMSLWKGRLLQTGLRLALQFRAAIRARIFLTMGSVRIVGIVFMAAQVCFL